MTASTRPKHVILTCNLASGPSGRDPLLFSSAAFTQMFLSASSTVNMAPLAT
jgi:hypothetical protein